MTFEEIKEPIEVIGYFDGQSVRPLRFRWRQRAYRISQIHGVWNHGIGRDKEYHFHVTTRDAGSFELIYNNKTFVWKLGRANIDGS